MLSLMLDSSEISADSLLGLRTPSRFSTQRVDSVNRDLGYCSFCRCMCLHAPLRPFVAIQHAMCGHTLCYYLGLESAVLSTTIPSVPHMSPAPVGRLLIG
jgi:hypothetical protein